MTTEKSSTEADMSALASEVMDLWQDHLAVYASDPSAKAELMRLLEPQRRLFADWATMMQNGGHGTGNINPEGEKAGNAERAKSSTAPRATSAQSSPDDSTLRMAQLAYRTSQLEKYLEKLEQRIDNLESEIRGTARKTPSRTKSRKS